MCLGKITTSKGSATASDIPLTGASVHATLTDLCAKVKVVQRFHNKTAEAQEISYSFALPKGAAVCHFQADVDGKIIISKLKEKEAAKNEYDDAISSGHGAFLAEKKEGGEFNTSIGRLDAGKEVKLELIYVSELQIVGSDVQFKVPANNSISISESEVANSRYAGDFGQEIAVTVDVTMTSDIQKITSNLEIKQENVSSKTAKVQIPNLGKTVTNEINVNVTLASPFQPTFNIEENQAEKLNAAVSFYPDQSEAESDDQIFSEMIFLVDCSGSMSGGPIESAKQVVQIFLRSLPQTCYFNIIDFGSDVRMTFPESRPYNDENLKEAVKATASKDADLGGTDLMNPLREIFNKKSIPGYSRQIFLLTDGEVDDRDGTIAVAAKYAQSTRIFSFGIGSGVDVELVTKLAKETNGDVELVPDESKYEDYVMRQLIRAMKPSITDLSFTLDGLSDNSSVKVSPYHPPPVFSGDRVLIYFNLPKSLVEKNTSPVKATLRGRIGPNKFEQSVNVDLSKVKKVEKKEDGLVSFLYGSSAISDLEKRRSYLHTSTGELASNVTDEQVDKATVDTSLETGILCSKTAFVAVELREDATEGVSKLIQVKSNEVSQPSNRYEFEECDEDISYASIPTSTPIYQSKTSAYSYDSMLQSEPMDLSVSYAKSAPAPKPAKSLLGSIGGMFKSKKKASIPTSSSVAYAPPPVAACPSPVYRSAPAPLSSGPAPVFLSAPAPACNFLSEPIMDLPSKEYCDDMKFAEVEEEQDISYDKKESSPSFGSSSATSGSSSSNIIQTQNANGSFDHRVLGMLGLDSTVLQKDLPSGASGAEAEAVLLAVLVYSFLEQKRSGDQSTWLLVVKKSKGWAKKEAARLNISLADLEKSVSTILSTL